MPHDASSAQRPLSNTAFTKSLVFNAHQNVNFLQHKVVYCENLDFLFPT
jgi:hypothetical protein